MCELEKTVYKNSNILSALIKVAIVVVSVIVSLTMFYGDMSELPPRVSSLESRVAALELNSATTMAKIESSLNRLESDFNIVKTQIVRQGMQKELDN